jgi:hypothetical protein
MSRNSQISFSKNYVAKKLEAERIDFENRKLMARIVGSAGTINTREAQTNYNNLKKVHKKHQQNTSIMVVETII